MADLDSVARIETQIRDRAFQTLSRAFQIVEPLIFSLRMHHRFIFSNVTRCSRLQL